MGSKCSIKYYDVARIIIVYIIKIALQYKAIFLKIKYYFYIRISASTPAGRLRFCKESIVLGVASVISIRRL